MSKSIQERNKYYSLPKEWHGVVQEDQLQIAKIKDSLIASAKIGDLRAIFFYANQLYRVTSVATLSFADAEQMFEVLFSVFCSKDCSIQQKIKLCGILTKFLK